MCDYKIVKITRTIGKNESLILLSREQFEKVSKDVYLEVLANEKEQLNMSKSYYYYILSQLKKLKLIEDNAISFKAIIPVEVTSRGIEFDKSIAYVDKEDKTLIIIDMSCEKYSCPQCPVFDKCVIGLKKIAQSIGMKIGNIGQEARYTNLPSRLWNFVINSILNMYLKNLKSIKI